MDGHRSLAMRAVADEQEPAPGAAPAWATLGGSAASAGSVSYFSYLFTTSRLCCRRRWARLSPRFCKRAYVVTTFCLRCDYVLPTFWPLGSSRPAAVHWAHNTPYGPSASALAGIGTSPASSDPAVQPRCAGCLTPGAERLGLKGAGDRRGPKRALNRPPTVWQR
jgi:hypothetical protein